MSPADISVVVPAYGRPEELDELLQSILDQTRAPQEVLVCEDMSPRRAQIRTVCEAYRQRFAAAGTTLTYVENEQNLGFDKNLRKCIESAASEWALIMGDDDALLREAVAIIDEHVQKSGQDFFSCAFVRFSTDTEKPVGTSKISDNNEVFSARDSAPSKIFKAARFISGLVVRVPFARKFTCSDFDGTLYYQVYLAAVAFCTNGIGYIASPLVAGRTDNPPLFGNALDERGLHVPGRYTAKGRTAMWRGVLEIGSTVGHDWDVDLVTDLRHELKVRESFHVFEMNAGAPREELNELRSGLKSLGLFAHPLPRALFTLDYTLGKHARPFYRLARAIFQRRLAH